ncbi:YadA-like family protein [Actinobacillus genomosp. 1]|uniref:YadA-like family protein n=1 Tax=Actinobacillus genomosp. 1 TaxID=254839 RepID=UPI002442FA5B|nr:YadA-like family protein [Actinobacillus genomosp. 1]WGE90589.1 YadA-like family protein [Actinobacillus genomosp. 1]
MYIQFGLSDERVEELKEDAKNYPREAQWFTEGGGVLQSQEQDKVLEGQQIGERVSSIIDAYDEGEPFRVKNSPVKYPADLTPISELTIQLERGVKYSLKNFFLRGTSLPSAKGIGPTLLAPYDPLNNERDAKAQSNLAGATAYGTDSEAKGLMSTALGFGSLSLNNFATAIGAYATAEGQDSTAVGKFSHALGQSSSAYGHLASAQGLASSAFGHLAIAEGESATATGHLAVAQGDRSSAYGNGAKAAGEQSSAVGYLSTAEGDKSSAFGSYANALSESSSAYGFSSIAKEIGASAYGTLSIANDKGASAYGTLSIANGEGASAYGHNAFAEWNAASAYGENSYATGGASAFGHSSQASGWYSSAFGSRSISEGSASSAFGDSAMAEGDHSSAFGSSAMAVGSTSSAYGHKAISYGRGSSAYGNNAFAYASSASAFGISSQALDFASAAYGAGAYSLGKASTAIGMFAHANGSFSSAFGAMSKADSEFSTATGFSARADELYTTATGAFSHAEKASASAYGNFSSATGEAASAFGYLAMAHQNNATAMGSIALAEGNNATAIGTHTIAKLDNSVALGSESDTGDQAAFDKVKEAKFAENLKAKVDNQDVTTDWAGKTAHSVVSVGRDEYKDKDKSIASLERRITHVAAGNITANSTDAINGSQIYSIVKALKDFVQPAPNPAPNPNPVPNPNPAPNPTETVKVEGSGNISVTTVNKTATVSLNKDVNLGESGSLVAGDTKVSDKGISFADSLVSLTSDGLNNGDKKVTNVAAGEVSANSKDAVNGTQLHATNQNVTNLQNEVAKGWNLETTTVDGSVSKSNVKMGDTVKVKAGNNIEITQNGSNIAIATSKTPSFDSVKVGKGDNTATIETVKDNYGSALKVSGANGQSTRITNLADGKADSDAVNVGQLKRATNNINRRLDRVNKDLRAGIAGAMAMGNLYQANMPGKSMVSAGVGTYKDQGAIAVGYSRLSDNGNIGVKISVNGNTRGDTGAAASFGYQW